MFLFLFLACNLYITYNFIYVYFLTYHLILYFLGALNTMKALADSDLQRYPRDSAGTLYSYNEVWSIALNTTDPSQLNNPDWLTARNNFLEWHGLTRNTFVSLIATTHVVILMILVISTIVVFFFFDTEEIMFPPLLEIKQRLSEWTNYDIHSVQKFHFIRPHRFIYELGFWLSFVTIPVFVYIFVPVMGPIVAIISGTFIAGSGGFVLGMMICGLIVQIHNATTLSNMLVEMCKEELQEKEKLMRFEEWKEFYKTSVGALHVWSWRMTPIFGSVVAFLGVSIIRSLSFVLFLYTSIMSEPDIIESERFMVFQNSKRVRLNMFSLFFSTAMLLGLVGFMSMVSVRYQRLHILIATLGLPQHHLDDFNILQEHNAALTIFDIPIKVTTTIAILKLLLVQSVIAILAMLG